MVTRRIKTSVGTVWALYKDKETALRYDGDSTLLAVTNEQAVFLTANPHAEWDGEKFVVPAVAEETAPSPSTGK